MKISIASLLLLLAVASPALANGTPPAPTPSPTYAPSSTQNVDTRSWSHSDAAAAAAARAGATSSSSAQGGSATAAGGSSGPSTSGSSLTDASNTRAYGIALPGPSVPAMLPSARDCIGTTNWSAAAPLFLGSGGSSNQGVIPECLVALQVDVLRQACQFDSANRLQAELVSRLVAFRIEPAVDVNLTDEQCRARNAPAPVLTPTPIVFEAPAAPQACVIEPTPTQRRGAKAGLRSNGCPKPQQQAAR